MVKQRGMPRRLLVQVIKNFRFDQLGRLKE
jgi:hypothetical protein